MRTFFTTTAVLSALAADAGHSLPEAAQPVPSAETVAAITTADADTTAKRKRIQRAKREAATGDTPPAKPAKPGKRAAKPTEAEAAKPVKAANDAARLERQSIIDAGRDTAKRYYAGASIAAHRAKPSPRDAYVSRACNPVQQCAGGVLSMRDESGLALLLSVSTKAGTFDPCACAFDVGILSRLASVDLVTYAGDTDTFALTANGAKRARAIVNRAKRDAQPAA